MLTRNIRALVCFKDERFGLMMGTVDSVSWYMRRNNNDTTNTYHTSKRIELGQQCDITPDFETTTFWVILTSAFHGYVVDKRGVAIDVNCCF